MTAKKPPALTMKLTLREMELLYSEMECSIGCGAEDPDYIRIRDKALAALKKHNSKPSNA